jgi:hypothetical protein
MYCPQQHEKDGIGHSVIESPEMLIEIKLQTARPMSL